MAPIYDEFRRSDLGEDVHRDFEGANVKVRRFKSAPGSKPETKELKVDEPVFDYYGPVV